MGEELLTIVLKLVDIVVCGELRIAMSSKLLANLAAASSCGTVGARYVATTYKLQVAPRLETLEKKESRASELLSLIVASSGKAATVSIKTVERFCGLHCYMCQFIPDGNALPNSVNSLLKQKAASKDKRLVSKDETAVGDIRVILAAAHATSFYSHCARPLLCTEGAWASPRTLA